MSGSFKRRQYPIVSRRRQYRMLLLMLAYSGILCGVLFFCLLVPEILLMQNEAADIHVRAGAADRLLSLHARLWPTVVAIICVMGLHSFRVFTRFVGPLLRFRWAFSGITAGDLTRRVHLRTGDELTAEADAFNEMMDRLTERLHRVHAAAGTALETARQLAAALAPPGPAVSPLAGEMVRQAAGVEAELRDFIMAEAQSPDAACACTGG